MSFAVGDAVYLSTKYLDVVRHSRKLDYKYIGLFEVLEVLNRHAYRLSLPEGINIYLVFYVLLLKRVPLPSDLVLAREQTTSMRFKPRGLDVYEVDLIKD